MTAIEPFVLPVNETEAAWVRERVAAYRFFEESEGAGWEYGANRAYLENLRDFWLNGFDWPAAVAKLNRHLHFRVDVGDGFRLHCVHQRSSRADARPLLIAHGWPGSILEFDAIIERFAEPEDPSLPAFHVVAPSLPGYVWSDRPKSPLGPRAVARLYDTLMGVLGYDRYMYQGGDWGSVIGGWIGLDSKRVTAVHLNGYGLRAADMCPTAPEETKWICRAVQVRARESAYLQLQGTKPQSLAYAMMDLPMGVAAFPTDLLALPSRAMVERGYNVVHWTDMPHGGHFASIEEPELFLADVRKFAGAL